MGYTYFYTILISILSCFFSFLPTYLSFLLVSFSFWLNLLASLRYRAAGNNFSQFLFENIFTLSSHVIEIIVVCRILSGHLVAFSTLKMSLYCLLAPIFLLCQLSVNCYSFEGYIFLWLLVKCSLLSCQHFDFDVRKCIIWFDLIIMYLTWCMKRFWVLWFNILY